MPCADPAHKQALKIAVSDKSVYFRGWGCRSTATPSEVFLKFRFLIWPTFELHCWRARSSYWFGTTWGWVHLNLRVT